ncbi:hypothetical protein A5667_27445 [Mycolicibacterium fortuitum]|uniref:caspase family protein n=1 Tax=Mycolicibacterium fortuitum TaxID=1766 RepID=UPI0007EC9398|nr:caspase family protein [Mycolicibacterium fortuitum]OBI65125.1 hypothetical protein A5667_27445 [Mycolicibacterium fortuitum]
MLISTHARTNVRPVTHAFIIGVSRYPCADGPGATEWGRQFGIENLSTAARSASNVARWLLDSYCNPQAPLATIRILLSPAEGEGIDRRIASLMGQAAAPATRDAVETEFHAFVKDCRTSADNCAVVYVAGHGAQLTSREALVLLEDFGVEGRTELHGAIDVVGCHQALQSAGSPDHQLWLCDACRQRPHVARRFETLTGAFRPSKLNIPGRPVPRSRALFLAASPGERAYAVPGGSTLFSQALLAGLNGAAARSPAPECNQWHVSPTSMLRFLGPRVNGALVDTEAVQTVELADIGSDMIFHLLPQPPDVDIVVNLNPADAQPVPRPELSRHGVGLVASDTWPLVYRGEAGIYSLSVTVEPPLTRGVSSFPFLAEPPQCVQSAEVS